MYLFCNSRGALRALVEIHEKIHTAKAAAAAAPAAAGPPAAAAPAAASVSISF